MKHYVQLDVAYGGTRELILPEPRDPPGPGCTRTQFYLNPGYTVCPRPLQPITARNKISRRSAMATNKFIPGISPARVYRGPRNTRGAGLPGCWCVWVAFMTSFAIPCSGGRADKCHEMARIDIPPITPYRNKSSRVNTDLYVSSGELPASKYALPI